MKILNACKIVFSPQLRLYEADDICKKPRQFMPTESKPFTTQAPHRQSYYSLAENDLRLLPSKCISLCAALLIVNARLRCREVPMCYTCKSPATRSALALRVFFAAPSAYNSAAAESSLLWMRPRRYPARIFPGPSARFYEGAKGVLAPSGIRSRESASEGGRRGAAGVHDFRRGRHSSRRYVKAVPKSDCEPRLCAGLRLESICL